MPRQFVWVPADGSAPLALNDAAGGYRLMAAGTRGLSAPPYRSTSSMYAGQDGTTLESLQADEREINLGMQIEATSALEFRRRWRALVRAFRPLAGDGQLMVTDEEGVVRTVKARYESGLEGDGEAEFAGDVGRAVVKLKARDPWFYGPTRALSVGLGAPQPFFPIFPLTLAPSTIQGGFTVDLSDTDSPAYPVWTVTGPGTSLALTNVTTGRVIQINATLAAGEQLQIDTRPGRRSVRRLVAGAPGPLLMSALASDPALWPLVDGVNQVSAALAGATAASRIVGQYEPRYSGI